MKASSNTMPELYRINGNTVYFTDNITEETIEDEMSFKYDEYAITLYARTNMDEYITTNYDELFAYVKAHHLEVESTRLETEYKAKVIDFVRGKYTVEDEIGLTNDCSLAMMSGSIIPNNYTLYRTFVEEQKDIAHMEVFGYERT